MYLFVAGSFIVIGSQSPVVPTFKTPEEATVAAKRRSSRLKTGGITGCPHRENGVKSDIKGISDIQVTGKKFIGIK